MVLQLGLHSLQLGLFVRQCLTGRLQLLQHLVVLFGDLLQRIVKGEHFIQAAAAGKHSHRAAVMQLLHGHHALLKIAPALVDLALLFFHLLLLVRHLIAGVGDLIDQHRDLVFDQIRLVFQTFLVFLSRRFGALDIFQLSLFLFQLCLQLFFLLFQLLLLTVIGKRRNRQRTAQQAHAQAHADRAQKSMLFFHCCAPLVLYQTSRCLRMETRLPTPPISTEKAAKAGTTLYHTSVTGTTLSLSKLRQKPGTRSE